MAKQSIYLAALKSLFNEPVRADAPMPGIFPLEGSGGNRPGAFLSEDASSLSIALGRMGIIKESTQPQP